MGNFSQSVLRAISQLEAEPNNRRAWRIACLDLYFFETAVLSRAWTDKFQNFGEIHRRMCNFLDTRITPSRRKALSAFRGSYKTTVLLGFFIWFFVWNLAQRKSNGIIYNTAVKDNAYLFQGDIKHTLLENELLHWIFPEIPRQESSYDSMTVKRIAHKQVKMDFASLDQTLVSRHYPIWVNDDLENDKNAATDTLREGLKTAWKYQKAILTKIRSKGVGLEIDIGTPFHFQGLMWDILTEKKSYDKLITPCFIDRDRAKGSSFPERYTVEDFDEVREDMGETMFSALYLLYPLNEANQLCPERWLKYWDKLPELAYRLMIVDPGGSDPSVNDATGITITDTDEKGDMYVIYADELWLTPVQLIDKINELKKLYDVNEVRVEKERYTVTIADTWQHRFPLMHVGYAEHKGRKKPQRIWTLRQWFETGRIFIHPNQKAFKNQLIRYPQSPGNRDDILDSLAYHLDHRRVPRAKPKIYLPSGKEWNPSIDPSFDEEIDRVMKFNKEKEGAEYYDRIY